MKVIYYGSAATYAAYGMAAIHLGVYKGEEIPSYDEMIGHWNLCMVDSYQRGNLVYLGLDEELREVYIIGCGSHGRMLKKAYKGFGDLYKIDDVVFYVDASPWERGARFLVSLTKKIPMIEPIARRLYIHWYRRIYPIWTYRVRKEWKKLSGRGTP